MKKISFMAALVALIAFNSFAVTDPADVLHTGKHDFDGEFIVDTDSFSVTKEGAVTAAGAITSSGAGTAASYATAGESAALAFDVTVTPYVVSNGQTLTFTSGGYLLYGSTNYNSGSGTNTMLVAAPSSAAVGRTVTVIGSASTTNTIIFTNASTIAMSSTNVTINSGDSMTLFAPSTTRWIVLDAKDN